MDFHLSDKGVTAIDGKQKNLNQIALFLYSIIGYQWYDSTIGIDYNVIYKCSDIVIEAYLTGKITTFFTEVRSLENFVINRDYEKGTVFLTFLVHFKNEQTGKVEVFI